MKCSYSYPYLKQIFNYRGGNHSLGSRVLGAKGPRGWGGSPAAAHLAVIHKTFPGSSSVGQR